MGDTATAPPPLPGLGQALPHLEGLGATYLDYNASACRACKHALQRSLTGVTTRALLTCAPAPFARCSHTHLA